MVAQVLSLLGTAISAMLGFFEDILTSTGLLPIFLGVFSAVMIVRFIVMPLLGGGTGGRNDKNGGDSD